jgi:hypothetical protein
MTDLIEQIAELSRRIAILEDWRAGIYRAATVHDTTIHQGRHLGDVSTIDPELEIIRRQTDAGKIHRGIEIGYERT